MQESLNLLCHLRRTQQTQSGFEQTDELTCPIISDSVGSLSHTEKRTTCVSDRDSGAE
jgi:hypothetical protein